MPRIYWRCTARLQGAPVMLLIPAEPLPGQRVEAHEVSTLLEVIVHPRLVEQLTWSIDRAVLEVDAVPGRRVQAEG